MSESQQAHNPTKSSLIELSHFNRLEVSDLFRKCIDLKRKFHSNALPDATLKGVAVLLFFEPSTRTRFSFEAACARAGVHPLILGGASGTSLEKGETMEDTIFNLEAMRPLFFVIRCPDELDLNAMDRVLSVPILNAGWGMQGHPTQALLDGVTLFERWKSLEGKKVLFVGDIKHSRVVSSHLQLSKIMGYKIGYCAPEPLLPEDIQANEAFMDLDKALAWADAVVGLRVQKERHARVQFSVDHYRAEFGLNKQRLQMLKPDGLILHPGPINYGVELETEVLSDKRSVILQLVENGAFMRETLVRRIISGESQ